MEQLVIDAGNWEATTTGLTFLCNELTLMRKIRLERIPSTETRIKLVVANNPALPVVTWNVAAVPHPELAEPWVNDTAPKSEVWSNDTRPMKTEPGEKLSHEKEIQYRRCDCALAVDWCICRK